MSKHASRQQETDGTDVAQSIDTPVGARERVPVAGGTLVYETRQLGRELIGFEDVEDWDDVADALAARGHARGHVYHLPELDAVEGGH
jgi:hypothetical protein